METNRKVNGLFNDQHEQGNVDIFNTIYRRVHTVIGRWFSVDFSLLSIYRTV